MRTILRGPEPLAAAATRKGETMRCVIDIETSSDSFREGSELQGVLEQLAKRVGREGRHLAGTFKDSNGNIINIKFESSNCK